ncbi:MAG: hypothetical protein PUB22_01875 [Clostridiales bacterium]|nr:hypothetical protein [Clostridiales bacterium]
MIVKSGKTTNNVLLSIGIVLCIIGVSLGGIVKLIFKTNFSWISTLVSVLSVVFMLDSRRILQFKYRRPTPLIWAIFLYSLITLIMASLTDYSFSKGPYSLINQLVYFIQIVILWDRGNDINIRSFQRVALWIMTVSGVISFVLIIQNSALTGMLVFNRLLDNTEATTGVSRVTMGAIGFVGLISALPFQAETLWDKAARYCCLFASIAVFGIAARRSVYLAAVLALCIHVRNSGINSIHVKRKILMKVLAGACLLLIFLYSLYTFNPTVREMTDRAFQTLVRGIQTYLGINNTDLAAGMRRENINTIPYEFLNHSTLFQFVFGHGYMAKWMDIPFMQAFWDLGIVGGIFYIWVMGVVPIIHLLRPSRNPLVMFAQYNLALTFVESFANGAPYGRFFVLVLLLIAEEKAKQEKIASVIK